MNNLVKFVIFCLFVVSGFGQSVSETTSFIFGDKLDKIYYIGNCGEQFEIAQNQIIIFRNESEAVSGGYSKSSKCTEVKPVAPTIKPVVSDDPIKLSIFYEDIKHIFVKKPEETDVEHIVRIKTELKAKQFNGKPVSETAIVIDEGFWYDTEGGILKADFYRRKIVGSEVMLSIQTLPYGYLMNGVEIPEMYVSQFEVRDIKKDLRLAIYGFPFGFDKKNQVLIFVPLRYVFFNNVSGLVHLDTLAKSQFAEYYARNDVPAAAVMQLPEDFGVSYGYGSPMNVGGRVVHVRGYYRGNGTYVRPHTRSYPTRRRP